MKNLYSLLLAFFVIISSEADTHYINTGNYYYSPSNTTIALNDTVIWINDGGYHNVNFINSSITGTSFGNPISFISAPTGASTIYQHIFTTLGSYTYDCSVGSHAAAGMVGSIEVASTDCNGIANGPAMIDSCGVCQLAYVYNYVTHAVSFINDTTGGVVLGPTQMFVLPNNPASPYWNQSCSGCTDPTATNYVPNATIDDGSCTYPSAPIYDLSLQGILDFTVPTFGSDGKAIHLRANANIPSFLNLFD